MSESKPKEHKIDCVPTEELEKIADGIVRNLIFTSLHVRPEDWASSLGLVFLPIALGALEDIDLASVGMAYEYREKSLPRGINGYPIFMSVKLLNSTDTEAVCKMVKEMEEALAGVKEKK